MKYQIYRTSSWDYNENEKPCNKAYKGEIEVLDRRIFNTPEQMKKQLNEDWFARGYNHTTWKYNPNDKREKEKIQRTLCKKSCYYIDINSIEELMELEDEVGDLSIRKSALDETTPAIEIYDDYRE